MTRSYMQTERYLDGTLRLCDKMVRIYGRYNGKAVVLSEYPVINGNRNGVERSYNHYPKVWLTSVKTWANGLLEGPSFHYLSEGVIAKIEEHSKGKRTGTRTWFYSNGCAQIRTNLRKGLRTGIQIHYFKDRSIEREVLFIRDAHKKGPIENFL